MAVVELVVATAVGIVCLYAVVVGTVEARGLKKKTKRRAYSVEKLTLIRWRGEAGRCGAGGVKKKNILVGHAGVDKRRLWRCWS